MIFHAFIGHKYLGAIRASNSHTAYKLARAKYGIVNILRRASGRY